MVNEPLATAIILATFGALLIVSVLFSRASEQFSIPVALVFLVIGMLAGSEGIGGIAFEDYELAFRLGTVALALILFDGGMNTPLKSVREAAKPAAVLATAGVIMTAGVVAVAARMVGLSWPQAFLFGAIVSSTDAAAVFAVLRGSGLHLKRRIATTLEVESGSNDPMAIILTIATTQYLVAPSETSVTSIVLNVVFQMVVGGALGLLIGRGGQLLLTHVRLPVGGLYPALTMGLAFIAFSVPTILLGSGFLAVYVAGVLIGNGQLPFKPGLLRFHDAVAWLGQITMFLLFGMLVFPSRLASVAGIGFALAIITTVVARPIVVALCLAPFRMFRSHEVAFMGWVGLRGAVPIILAIFPVLSGAPGALSVFDIVFFTVVVNAIIPGATVSWVTRKLGLQVDEPPAPRAVLEIESMQPLDGELISFYIDEDLAVTGVRLGDLPLPEAATPILVVRERDLLSPLPDTILNPGDHFYIYARPDARPILHLMFGLAEGD